MRLVAAVLVLALSSDAALHTLRGAVRTRVPTRAHAARMTGDDSWDGGFMDELNSRIRSSQNTGARMGAPEAVLEQLSAVFVLIFNLGTIDEGVYTLQGTVEENNANPYVLAFEQTDEAYRFAELLEAEGFDLPQPLEWGADRVSHFCDQNQFQLGVVPTGALLTPPEKNCYDVEAFDELKNSQGSLETDMVRDRSPVNYDETRQFLEGLFNEDPGGDDTPW